MNRYNELKLSQFANGEWLTPDQVAQQLNFFPQRSVWTYLKRLWSFGLVERRYWGKGKGTLAYRISDAGLARLRWLRSQNS
jgi:hypothetical protein